MAKLAGVVEIDGHRYDSSTGAVVGVIDGFVRSKSSSAQPAKKAAAKKTAAAPAKKIAAAARPVKPSAKVHHRTERSKTLMRTMVMRPALRVRDSAASVTKIAKVPQVDEKARQARAKLVSKSPHISRFGSSKQAAKPAEAKREGVIKKVAHVRPLHSASAAPGGAAALSAASHQQLERILDQALASADAHKQTLKQRKNRILRPFGIPRWAALILLVLLILLAGLLVAWRSVPAVAIKMAAVRSHINASLPAYVPAGFSFQAVESAPGNVTIHYGNKSAGDAGFSVSQSQSQWDSQSLQANTLKKDETVQTSQVGGTTVYIYGASDNAEWVTNGSLYKINNDGHLTSDQILHIAQSL